MSSLFPPHHRYGADPNLPSGHDQETPLTAAVVEDRFNLARALLAYGGDATHIVAGGDSLLMMAIRQRRSRRIVELLLDYGADANAKDLHGHTPMFEAIQSHRIEIVASLLNHRANPNLPGPKHMLWPAAGLPRILELLLARGADPKKAPGVMELATSENNVESVRVLLKAGVDANAKKDGIYTPLCSSIRDDRADIFDLLLANGAGEFLPPPPFSFAFTFSSALCSLPISPCISILRDESVTHNQTYRFKKKNRSECSKRRVSHIQVRDALPNAIPSASCGGRRRSQLAQGHPRDGGPVPQPRGSGLAIRLRQGVAQRQGAQDGRHGADHGDPREPPRPSGM